MTTTINKGMCAALALAMCAGTTLAALPGAMDYVPSDAVAVAVIRDLNEFHDDIQAFEKKLPDASFDLGAAGELLQAPGLNGDGSLALALMPTAGGDVQFDPKTGEGPMVLIVPVSDFGQFVKGFGAAAGQGIVEVEAMGKTLFVKDLAGGFCAMSADQGLMDRFAGAAGNAAKYEGMLGASGVDVVEHADTTLIFNISTVREPVAQAIDMGMQQARFFTAMAGAQAAQLEGQIAVIEKLAKGFARDGKSGIVGIDLADAGFSLDFGASFTDGSEFAGFFQGGGDAAALLDKIPATPYFFAGGFDTSSEGLRNLMSACEQAAGEQAGPSWSQIIGSSNGIAAMIGSTQAIMGGMFTKTSVYYDVKDTNAFLTEQQKTLADINGADQGMFTYETSFTANTGDLGGVSVSEWAMKIVPDASDPNAMQIQQMMAMMYGPAGGPSGYMGAVDNGVVMTLAKDEATFGKAVGAATGAEASFATDPGVKSVMGHLPSDGSFYEFISVSGIMDAVSGMMMMMGGGADIAVPADLPPVAIGGTTDHGAFRARIFVPSEVITAISDVAENMDGAQAADADDGGKPRF